MSDPNGSIVHIDVAAVEETAKKFVVRFVGVWVSAILTFWLGLSDQNVTGLIDAVKDDWNSAAGIALIAAIVASGGGFLLGQAKTQRAKRLAARL